MFSFRQQEYTFSESVGEAEVCIDKNGTTGLVLYVNVSGSESNIYEHMPSFVLAYIYNHFPEMVKVFSLC